MKVVFLIYFILYKTISIFAINTENITAENDYNASLTTSPGKGTFSVINV